MTTVDTFCGSVDYPGTTKWSLLVTLYQSFDVRRDRRGPVCRRGCWRFGSVRADRLQDPGGVGDESEVDGHGASRPVRPINGDAGDASTVEIEWAVTSGPVKGITPVLLMADELEALTVDELKALADQAGLPTTGTKAELVTRLSAEPA